MNLCIKAVEQQFHGLLWDAGRYRLLPSKWILRSEILQPAPPEPIIFKPAAHLPQATAELLSTESSKPMCLITNGDIGTEIRWKDDQTLAITNELSAYQVLLLSCFQSTKYSFVQDRHFPLRGRKPEGQKEREWRGKELSLGRAASTFADQSRDLENSSLCHKSCH